MMAQAVPNPLSDKKRVKVYELKDNDWFDRGTGFCTAVIVVCSADSILPWRSKRARCTTRLSIADFLWRRPGTTNRVARKSLA